ncbi:hypothetical protein NUM3379_43150 [Kineococcus sp. NUM-3379]
MNDTTMTTGLEGASPVVRRSAREVPTARWVPTVGTDGRRRLSMQWSVPARTAATVPARHVAHHAA